MDPTRSVRSWRSVLFPGGLAVMAALLVLGSSGAASAQDRSGSSPGGQAAEGTQAAQNAVESVTVTARRREESIRDVPAAVTAVTAGELQDTGPVSGTGDLLRTVPGVRFNDIGAANLSEITIRGSGSQRATGADSSIGLFYNGAYVGSSIFGGRNYKEMDFFDAERLEVLKGPQGALYGRNSEFGTLNLIPAKPSFKFTGYVDETYIARLDQNRVTGVFNLPLNDDFALRIGAESYTQDGGIFRNPLTGNYYDRTDGYVFRTQLRYKHGPLDIDLFYDAEDLLIPTFVNSLALVPGVSPAIPLGYTADPLNVPLNGQNNGHQIEQRGMITVGLDLGWAKLLSTTLNSELHSETNYATAGVIDLGTEAMFQSLNEPGVYPLGRVNARQHDSTLYEDMHATGLLFGRVTWLVGGEWLHQRDSNGNDTFTNPCGALTATSGICGGVPGAQVCYQLLSTSKPCPAVYPNPFGNTTFTPQRYISYAGYGDLTFDLGAGVSLDGGLRYTNDDKRASNNAFRLFTRTPFMPNSSFQFDSDRINYAVVLSWKLPLPSRFQQLLYVRTATGYRAGGINPGVALPGALRPFQPTYGDEDTTNYEAGLKGNLGRNIYFELIGYMSRTTNAITTVTDGCTVLTCGQGVTVFNINGGTQAAQGVEAKFQANFNLFGGRTSLVLTGTDQEASYVANAPGLANGPFIGSTVAQTPHYLASAFLDYTHRLVADVDGFFNVTANGTWGGGQDTTTPLAAFIPLQDYTLLSLRGGVRWRGAELAMFVKNATDEFFPFLVTKQNAVTGTVLAYRYNQPITFGVDLNYRW